MARKWRRSSVMITFVPRRSASATTEASVPPSGKLAYRLTSADMRGKSSGAGASTSNPSDLSWSSSSASTAA